MGLLLLITMLDCPKLISSANSKKGMNMAIALHQIKPVIDRVFPFSEAPEAYRYLRDGRHLGKVVIQI
jgi:NADPH:quinone reductase-like Zn-dependent oxidoreductase